MDPARAFVYWMEYVIRLNGANHLRPNLANFSWGVHRYLFHDIVYYITFWPAIRLFDRLMKWIPKLYIRIQQGYSVALVFGTLNRHCFLSTCLFILECIVLVEFLWLTTIV